MARTKRTYSEIQADILAALDLRAEYIDLGVKIAEGQAGADGWLACYAVDREDQHASAAVNLKTGHYKDSGGSGLSLSFWDLATHVGKFATWKDAREHYAKKAKVKLPGKDTKDPTANLEFLPWNDQIVALWARHKPGVTAEAARAAGGRLARYHYSYIVVALPVFGHALAAADPVGWVLYNTTGKELPIFHPGTPPTTTWKKMKTTSGSAPGIMGMDACERIASLRPPFEPLTVWKTEGPSDMMALWSAIPPDLRGSHLVVCNSNGATEHPKPQMATPFVNQRVFLCHDADEAGEAGERRWLPWLEKLAAEVRRVRLPYPIAASHGKDLRDYLNEGHGYTDLQDLAIEAEPLAEPLTGAGEFGVVAVETQATPRPTAGTATLERTITTSTDETRVIDEAIDALATCENVYQRGEMLVQIHRGIEPPKWIERPRDAPQAVIMQDPRIRELLAGAAVWLKPTGEGESQVVHPPDWVVKGIMARPGWPKIRQLIGIVEAPILRQNGSVLQTSGYDENTGIYFAPTIAFPLISERPTMDEVVAARDALLEVVCDFPFVSESHRAAWVAGVLTPLARYAFAGPAPLTLFDANQAGCGKGLLIDVTAMITLGRKLSRMSQTSSDEEFRKRITAIALSGEPIVLIDNIDQAFGGASLDAALTATSWSDRILGKSELAAHIPLYTVWYATGNNVVLMADTSRRVVHVRIKTLIENPEKRSDFKHPDLPEWTRTERPRITAAAVTILAGYCAAGRPNMGLAPWGSFEGWSDLVRSAVVWCGLADPGESRVDLASTADREAVALRALLAGWSEIDLAGYGKTVVDVLRELADRPHYYEGLRSALFELAPPRDGKTLNPRSVGMKLNHFRERVVDGRYFNRRDTDRGGVWHVVSTGDITTGVNSIAHSPESQFDQEYRRLF